MSDRRLKKAWRDWVVDGSPEAAQRYCVEVARSEQAPAAATILSSIDWAKLPRYDDVKSVVYKAASSYLGMEPDEACLEELAWVSEEHYFLLGNVGPSVLRTIGRVYEEHGLELKPGDEDEAQEDYETRSSARQSSELRKKHRELQRDYDNMERSSRRLEEQNAMYIKHVSRLEADIRKYEGTKAEQFEIDGLQSTIDILRKENARLTKLVQGKKE